MKKIDLFFNGGYIASTNNKTCKAAKQRLLTCYQDQITYANSGYTDKHYEKLREVLNNPSKLTAFFSKGSK